MIQKLKIAREQFTLSELQEEVSKWNTDELVQHVENIRSSLRKKEDELKELREKETLLRKWKIFSNILIRRQRWVSFLKQWIMHT